MLLRNGLKTRQIKKYNLQLNFMIYVVMGGNNSCTTNAMLCYIMIA